MFQPSQNLQTDFLLCVCIVGECELTDGMIQNISFLTFYNLYFG